MLSIYTEKQNGFTILSLDGSIIADTVKKFEIATHSAIERNISVLVLDLKNVNNIDSLGISYLLKLSRKAILSDVELILCELSVSLKKFFETAKMDKFFNILSLSAFKEKYF